MTALPIEFQNQMREMLGDEAPAFLRAMDSPPALALRLNMPAFMLKLVSSVIVVFAIAGPYLKARWPELHRRLSHRRGKGGGAHA